MNKKNNSGDWNSGDWNSGNCNSGDWNSGDWNSGNCNSGNWNSGNWNSGNRNSGDWNSGNCNSGYFNTDEPKVRIFNKETDIKREDINFPEFIYNVIMTEWIDEEDMTDEEKKDNAHFNVEGGYLKTYDYKEAWAKAWNEASEEDKQKLFKLPNFDAEIFKEITGIDVFRNDNKKKELLDKADKLIKQAKELKEQAKKF